RRGESAPQCGLFGHPPHRDLAGEYDEVGRLVESVLRRSEGKDLVADLFDDFEIAHLRRERQGGLSRPNDQHPRAHSRASPISSPAPRARRRSATASPTARGSSAGPCPSSRITRSPFEEKTPAARRTTPSTATALPASGARQPASM